MTGRVEQAAWWGGGDLYNELLEGELTPGPECGKGDLNARRVSDGGGGNSDRCRLGHIVWDVQATVGGVADQFVRLNAVSAFDHHDRASWLTLEGWHQQMKLMGRSHVYLYI